MLVLDEFQDGHLYCINLGMIPPVEFISDRLSEITLGFISKILNHVFS